jgi:NAD(P)-dependent dehydrogenase (short-subunit alcohol dehydrogenase family)
LRSELAKDGITVTTVCPGLMRTGSARNAFFKGQHRLEYALFKIGDSIPIASMSAERAARKIVEACRHGDSFIVLGLPARLASMLAAHAPGLAASALGLVNRWLPGNGGIGTQRLRGYESESRLSQSWLTGLTDKAAARNNEFTMPYSGR